MSYEADVIVPSHGPIGTKTDLIRMRDYLARVRRKARKRFDAGVPEEAAARDIKLGVYASWREAERILLLRYGKDVIARFRWGIRRPGVLHAGHHSFRPPSLTAPARRSRILAVHLASCAPWRRPALRGSTCPATSRAFRGAA